MTMTGRTIDTKPFIVGRLLLQRIPSASAGYRANHEHYWRGYLCPLMLPSKWIERFGKLIEVRTVDELETERKAYRALMKPEAGARLAYYEVIDAGAEAR